MRHEVFHYLFKYEVNLTFHQMTNNIFHRVKFIFILARQLFKLRYLHVKFDVHCREPHNAQANMPALLNIA